MTTDYRDLMAAAAQAAGIAPQAIVQPEDRDVVLGGLRFHYLDWNQDHLPHAVFLHGGGLTAHTWDMAALLMRDKLHIVALDQRGHGDSDWTPNVEDDTASLMLEDTRAFIEHLGYEKLTLVGMSMGGMNAIRYAARYPERLANLVIVDVGPDVMHAGVIELEQFAQATETLDRFDDFLDRSIKFNPNRPVEHLRYSLTHSLRQTDDGKWTWKHDRRPRPNMEADALRERGERAASDLWDDVRAIRTRTLLLRGEKSNILSQESAERMVREMHDARLAVIPGAGHSVQGDNPSAFAQAVLAFLS
ncbi:MAG TPA: alpha/beta hydrolase [Dehalococcoidia bacterium]|nr:alpha/beta hydrolase [Dehalococcoidia bacterium]